MIQGTDFYPVGDWTNSRCPGSLIGHNINVTRVVWTGKMGKQATGIQTCLSCGASRRVIQYASKAR